jgi:hypothetical protein
LDKSGGPCSFRDSQVLLEELVKHFGWNVRQDSVNDINLTRISKERGQGRYTVIKYEYAPHLLEVAFSFFHDLNELEAEIGAVLTQISEAAGKAGLQIRNSPFLEILGSDPRVAPSTDQLRDLYHSRAVLFTNRGEDINLELANFPAVVAATQVQIGGTEWWKRAQVVPNLYAIEPRIMALSTLAVTTNLAGAKKLLEKRWGGYLQVFKGFPLVAFPDLKEWSLVNWVEALTRSPIIAGSNEAWAGYALHKLPALSSIDWNLMFPKVRDVQIIRPKLYGTLEFRGDPAQTSCRHILALAALRLGASILAILETKPRATFLASRAQWLTQANGGTLSVDTEILTEIRDAILKRKLGEEKFLDLFYECLGGNAA